jgi:hypothetical protein
MMDIGDGSAQGMNPESLSPAHLLDDEDVQQV